MTAPSFYFRLKLEHFNSSILKKRVYYLSPTYKFIDKRLSLITANDPKELHSIFIQ